MPNHAMHGKPFFARIMNELGELYAWHNDVRVVYNREKNSHSIHIKDSRNNKKYDFYLSPKYPFYPPLKIFVNDVIYNEYSFKVACPRFIPHLKHLSRHPLYNWYSIQQHSIISVYNWSPANKIIKIIDETYRLNDFKKAIKLIVILESIKEKFRIPEEIPIIEYLI